MVYVTGNWKVALAGLALSLGIFLVVYFTVIKSSTDTANQALQQGLQQSQQALDQGQQAIDQGGGGSKAAQQQLNAAQALTQCLSTAGTDTAAVADCQAQYGG